MKRAIGALLLLPAIVACGSSGPDDAILVLLLHTGQKDPFINPATAVAIDILEVIVRTAEGEDRFGVQVGEGPTFEREISLEPGSARVIIKGKDPSNGQLYSAGQSRTLTVSAGDTVAASVFFSPVETFARVGLQMVGPRIEPTAARLGDEDVLIVGGYEVDSAGTRQLVAPTLERYRHGDGSICAAGCLSGTAPAPRVDAIAVTLADGSVLFGLGSTGDGVADAGLYRTTTDGVTSKLEATGDTLPASFGAAAVRVDDTVFVLGGEGGELVHNDIHALRLSADTLTVDRQPYVLTRLRTFASAIVLDNGSILVVGGNDATGAVLTVEVVHPGAGSEESDGGAIPAARALLRGGRSRPSLVKLSDGSVLIAGGGTSELELFSLLLGRFGGLIDVESPPPAFTLLTQSQPAAHALGSSVLLAGGEPPDSSENLAVVFDPVSTDLTDPATTEYAGTYRMVRACADRRGGLQLMGLPDGAVLAVGGGEAGVTVPTTPNSGSAFLEVMVPIPD